MVQRPSHCRKRKENARHHRQSGLSSNSDMMMVARLSIGSQCYNDSLNFGELGMAEKGSMIFCSIESPIIVGNKTAVQTSRASDSPGSLSGLGNVTELFGSHTLADDRVPETAGFVVTVGISLIKIATVPEVGE